MEDNCNKYALSSDMEPKLRKLVQIQLADELNSLLGMSFKFDFDWLESCGFFPDLLGSNNSLAK